MKNVIPILIFVVLIAGVVWVAHDLTADPLKGDGLSSPSPTITPTPEATPIDPADIVQVDTSLEGETLTVNGHTQKQTISCTKYDRVYINGSGTVATVKGACSQIMVNGDKDQITADAVTEFVFNGTGNEVTYSRFVNGKVPSVVDNTGDNSIEKVPFTPPAKDPNKPKTK